ncbi:hypothetical protein BG011_002999 [Mortierella polycephala]|uniref:Uncharacterized protein n=1 Tax=Mortierella polycephala TaxID=41804 RepID=A0A9P6TU17_9FUNG|nr:hypothetical protein BG011_002999 [Mortierella polycephala]
MSSPLTPADVAAFGDENLIVLVDMFTSSREISLDDVKVVEKFLNAGVNIRQLSPLVSRAGMTLRKMAYPEYMEFYEKMYTVTTRRRDILSESDDAKKLVILRGIKDAAKS